MDLRHLLLAQHARTHSTAMAPSDLPLEDLLLADLSDMQVRRRPRPSLNSIAWYLWHMARAEDIALNVLVGGRPQVLDEGAWPDRLRAARRDLGTGMTDAEVTEFTERVDVPALRAYRAAVGQRTRSIIEALQPEQLDQAIGPAQIERLRAEGAFGPNASYLAEFWQGRPTEFFVCFTAIGHNYTQIGEAWVVRGELGAGGG